MQTLRTVLFRDGRPGHEKQSLGVISALKKIVDLEISEFVVKQSSTSRRMLDLAMFLFAPKRLFRENFRADLILGTGSSTHLHLLACKKITGGKAVICMKPSSLLIDRFDLCLVPFHDRPAPRANVFETVGPPNVSRISKNKDQNRALILLGGENQLTGKWHGDQFLAMIKGLVEKEPEKQWTISTSPRTPDHLEEDIDAMLRDHPHIEYMPFKNTQPGWVDQQYDLNMTVWVTADSMSMIYEALSAGCRVGILPVPWKRSENKFSYSVECLQSRNKVVCYNHYMAGDHQWGESNVLEEANRCAAEIIRRWWPKNLQ